MEFQIPENGLPFLAHHPFIPIHLLSTKNKKMEAYLQHHKHLYFATILKALHFKMDAFMYNLAYNSPYEMLLYNWISKLYRKGKTSEEALQLIYKARNILLLNSKNSLCYHSRHASKPHRRSNPKQSAFTVAI